MFENIICIRWWLVKWKIFEYLRPFVIFACVVCKWRSSHQDVCHASFYRSEKKKYGARFWKTCTTMQIVHEYTYLTLDLFNRNLNYLITIIHIVVVSLNECVLSEIYYFFSAIVIRYYFRPIHLIISRMFRIPQQTTRQCAARPQNESESDTKLVDLKIGIHMYNIDRDIHIGTFSIWDQNEFPIINSVGYNLKMSIEIQTCVLIRIFDMNL